MKKQYIAPQSSAFSYIESLTPLCASKEFGIGSSSDANGGTTSSAWSNKQQQPNQGGMWSHMDD